MTITKLLNRIQATAGHPDAAEGCRLIIGYVDEIKKLMSKAPIVYSGSYAPVVWAPVRMPRDSRKAMLIGIKRLQKNK